MGGEELETNYWGRWRSTNQRWGEALRLIVKIGRVGRTARHTAKIERGMKKN
jgi:hypothetical protein